MKQEMSLPKPVRDCLDRVLIQDRNPAYLVTDRTGVLIDKGGKLDIYHLENLENGRTLSPQADFLTGLLPLESPEMSLPCLQVAPQVFADIHCFRNKNRDFLVFVDATTSEARQGLLQQKANDLRLLRNYHNGFTDLLCSLDLAFLKVQDDQHLFLIGKAPGWIQHCGLQFVPEKDVYRVTSTEEFLYNFLSAEEDAQEERLKSGPWIQSNPDGVDWYFEATRVMRGKDIVLVIERLAQYEEPGFAILQKAREQSLEYLSLAKKEKMLREKNTRNTILLNAIPDWIFKINRLGIILDLKASMGKNPLVFANFLRKPLSEIFPEGAAEAMIRCAEVALAARTMQTCTFPLGPDDAPVQFEARVVAVSNEEAVLFVREL